MSSYISDSANVSSSQQEPPQLDPNKTTYTVAVKTTDKFGAGTDANVYIQLIGTTGKSASIQLKVSLNHRNKFERNHSDVFIFPNMNLLGDIKQVKIWHDNTDKTSRAGAAWHLEKVDVHDAKTNSIYRFPCNRWLSKKDDDGQLCRLLNCTIKRQKVPKHFRMQQEQMQQQHQQQPDQRAQQNGPQGQGWNPQGNVQAQNANQYQSVPPHKSRIFTIRNEPNAMQFQYWYHPFGPHFGYFNNLYD